MSDQRALFTWLRAEGLAVFLAALALYQTSGASWWLFAALVMAPDISMAGYLANTRTGALVYNLGHSYVGPMVLAVAGAFSGETLLTSGALVWAAHIGFDRMLGYGLKSVDGFKSTHLGQISGRTQPSS